MWSKLQLASILVGSCWCFLLSATLIELKVVCQRKLFPNKLLKHSNLTKRIKKIKKKLAQPNDNLTKCFQQSAYILRNYLLYKYVSCNVIELNVKMWYAGPFSSQFGCFTQLLPEEDSRYLLQLFPITVMYAFCLSIFFGNNFDSTNYNVRSSGFSLLEYDSWKFQFYFLS